MGFGGTAWHCHYAGRIVFDKLGRADHFHSIVGRRVQCCWYRGYLDVVIGPAPKAECSTHHVRRRRSGDCSFSTAGGGDVRVLVVTTDMANACTCGSGCHCIGDPWIVL